MREAVAAADEQATSRPRYEFDDEFSIFREINGDGFRHAQHQHGDGRWRRSYDSSAEGSAE